MATTKSKYQTEKLRATQGMFFFEAKFVSCLEIKGEEQKGEVTLRPTGSFRDDDQFFSKFSSQFGNFTSAISDGGMRNRDAKLNILFYLEFLAEENQCDIKFFENGHDALSEINTNAEIGSVPKYDPVDNTVTGEIKPKSGRRSETCPVAAEGGFIDFQLRYTEEKAEDDQNDKKAEWDNTLQWDNHPAEETTFQINLGDIPSNSWLCVRVN